MTLGQKTLPLGIQTFSDIIEGNNIYVDKTAYIHELLKPSKGVYFLSRPRRFGKSLLVSTLEAIFLGKKELFKDLHIHKTNYTWEVHPVIRLDMTTAARSNQEEMEESILVQLKEIAVKNALRTEQTRADLLLRELIQKLHEKTGKSVVILIDEYDKPLINQLEQDNLPMAKEIQRGLKDFYGVIKSSDEHIRFVLITGVSKFTKVSIFSDLNHLTDLTMDPKYAALCGYTQEELEHNFDPWITQLAETEALSKTEILAKIKAWYNGYRLTKADIKVYNPWSTLHIFNSGQFENHWFETGTPTFLIKLMKEKEFDVSTLHEPIGPSRFTSYDIEQMQLLPLLFQTGYLTIKGYDKEHDVYALDYPNFEVKRAFSDHLLTTYIHPVDAKNDQLRLTLMDALKQDQLDPFFQAINTLYAKIPSTLHQKSEAYYHSIFIAACDMAGLALDTEVPSSMGRADAILTSPTAIYIIEFKIDSPPETAIKQILDRRYGERHQGQGKPVIPVGVTFSTKERRITAWKVGLPHDS